MTTVVTVIFVVVAVPALQDGHWQLVLAAFTAVTFVQVAVILIVERVQRRRLGRAPKV